MTDPIQTAESRDRIITAIVEQILGEEGVIEMGDITAEWRVGDDGDEDTHIIQAIDDDGNGYAVSIRVEAEHPR